MFDYFGSITAYLEELSTESVSEMTNPTEIEQSKKNAAKAALAFIDDNAIIGIGSGTTVVYFVESLAKLIKEEKKENLKLIPSSLQIRHLLKKLNLQSASLWDIEHIDITIDGADEVDANLNLLKGGGGAHTFEKVLAYNSSKYIIIADFRKYVAQLCTNHPIPIEVLPDASNFVLSTLKKSGGNPEIRLASRKIGPVVTDNGNLIIDYFPTSTQLRDLSSLNRFLKSIPGVVETGLFLNMATTVIRGYPSKVDILNNKKSGKTDS